MDAKIVSIATPANGEPVPAKVDLPLAVSFSDGPPEPLVLADSFGDPETLFNSRAWLRKALEDAGATMTGGGVGCGQADLDIELEGCKFNVSIRPILSEVK